jgi:hypothetical protein
LISPHALFYEASLLLLPIIFLIDSWRGDEFPVLGIRANRVHTVAVPARESIPGLTRGSRLKPTGAHDRLVLSPEGTSVTEPGNSFPGSSLSPNRRLILVCFFATGYLWLLGPLIGFQPLVMLPVIVAVLILKELAPWRRLGSTAAAWRLPIGVTWGESPNAPSGKRS